MATAKAKATGAGSTNGAGAETPDDAAPKTLEVEGLSFELPAKLPFKALRNFRSSFNNIEGAIGFLEDVLGPDRIEQVWDLDLDVEAGLALVEKVLGLYGLTEGESDPSNDS